MSRGNVRNNHSVQFELDDYSLYAEFDVAYRAVDGCPLDEFDPPLHVKDQQFSGGTCLIDAQLDVEEGAGRTVRLSQECASTCPTKVLTDNGYVPSLKAIYPERVVVGIRLEDRSEVRTAVTALRAVSSRVSLRQLTNLEADATTEVSLLDLTDLTEKQRETVTLAISEGYYRQPRRTTISDIADELDISAPAASQRLSAVESKVMRRVFECGMASNP